MGNEVGLERAPHKSTRAHAQRGRRDGLYGSFGSLPATILHGIGSTFDEYHGLGIFEMIFGEKHATKKPLIRQPSLSRVPCSLPWLGTKYLVPGQVPGTPL